MGEAGYEITPPSASTVTSVPWSHANWATNIAVSYTHLTLSTIYSV